MNLVAVYHVNSCFTILLGFKSRKSFPGLILIVDYALYACRFSMFVYSVAYIYKNQTSLSDNNTTKHLKNVDVSSIIEGVIVKVVFAIFITSV